MSLHQADKVGHSFPSKPLLLMRNPLPPSRGRGSTSTWTAESFDQAPSLASHPLDAEHPPHLPHEDDHLSLFTPFAPPLSSFQQLLVHCPRGGKVMDQEVNILRCLSPCSRSSFKLDLCTVSTINLVPKILPNNIKQPLGFVNDYPYFSHYERQFLVIIQWLCNLTWIKKPTDLIT